MNTFKTVFLMTFMVVLLILLGSLIGGRQGMIIAFFFSLVMNVGSYWFSDKIVLMMYRAKPVSEAEAGFARYIIRTILSENQYDPTFMTSEKKKAMIIP